MVIQTMEVVYLIQCRHDLRSRAINLVLEGVGSVVSTPFYLLPVHSLFIPSHSSPPLLLPLTALIPTPFVTLREVPQPSRDNPILCSVSLSSLIPPLSISVSQSLLD